MFLQYFNWHCNNELPDSAEISRNAPLRLLFLRRTILRPDLFDSFVGTSFEMKNSGTFYYDAALADIAESLFRVKRWSEHPTALQSPPASLW